MIEAVSGPITVKSDQANPRLWWAIWICWLLGVVLTLLLMWQTHELRTKQAADAMQLPGCGPQQACEHVLTSQYSELFGQSLTTWSLGFYGLVAVVLLVSAFSFQLSVSPPLSLLLPVVASAGVTAGVWSVVVMALLIGQFCVYCLAVHLVNLVLFILTLLYARQEWAIRQKRRWEVALPPLPSTPIAIHVFLGVLLATIQLLVMSRYHGDAVAQQDDAGIAAAQMPLGLRKTTIDPLAVLPIDTPSSSSPDGSADSAKTVWTVKGKHDAPHRLVVYSCPTCPKCASVNQILSTLVKRYPDQLRVDVRFWPLWHSCNDTIAKGSVAKRHRDACTLSRYALAVAQADPEAFPGYLDWLYRKGAATSEALAIAEARVMVDEEALDKALDSMEVWQRLDRDMELGREFDIHSVPQMFVSHGQIYGGVTVANLEQLLIRHYNLKPADSPKEESLPVWIATDYLVEKARRGAQLAKRDRYVEAADVYREILHVKSDWPELAQRLAWLLATCPDASARNGKEAVHYARLAQRTAEQKGKEQPAAYQQFRPLLLDTLAAAYAEAGDFESAQDTAKQALDAYQEALNNEEATLMEERMQLYRRNEAYRDEDADKP